jgi:hypothetical protein
MGRLFTSVANNSDCALTPCVGSCFRGLTARGFPLGSNDDLLVHPTYLPAHGLKGLAYRR